VNVETREVVAMEVTTDYVHDSKVFPRLLEETESHRRVVKAYGDGHTTGGVYEFSESKVVETIIKLRKNSHIDTPSEVRERL